MKLIENNEEKIQLKKSKIVNNKKSKEEIISEDLTNFQIIYY